MECSANNEELRRAYSNFSHIFARILFWIVRVYVCEGGGAPRRNMLYQLSGGRPIHQFPQKGAGTFKYKGNDEQLEREANPPAGHGRLRSIRYMTSMNRDGAVAGGSVLLLYVLPPLPPPSTNSFQQENNLLRGLRYETRNTWLVRRVIIPRPTYT